MYSLFLKKQMGYQFLISVQFFSNLGTLPLSFSPDQNSSKKILRIFLLDIQKELSASKKKETGLLKKLNVRWALKNAFSSDLTSKKERQSYENFPKI